MCSVCISYTEMGTFLEWFVKSLKVKKVFETSVFNVRTISVSSGMPTEIPMYKLTVAEDHNRVCVQRADISGEK